uniref:Uncharacterized protein n=1 Tax=Steinernema glaseri TaxID=37863 RepID=A0A1I8AH89_9BILA
MDSVPFDFCLNVIDVIGTVDLGCDDWDVMQALTGRWRAAAKKYEDNGRRLSITVNFDEGKWDYTVLEVTDEDSLDEMLARNPRFLLFDTIDIGCRTHTAGISDEFMATCSKEYVFNRLIPFLVRQLRPWNHFSFLSNLSKEHALMFFDAFLNCKGFRPRLYSLDLPYFGPESEQFLTTMLEGDSILGWLSLIGWPHSEAVERLVLKFMSRRMSHLSIHDQPYHTVFHAEEPLKLNSTILKAVFDAWYRVEKSEMFSASAPWNGDLQPLLSIPVPPDVHRTLLQPKRKGGDESFIVWTKKNMTSLLCRITLGSVEFSDEAYDKV